MSRYTYGIFILYLTARVLSILKELITVHPVQNFEVPKQYQFSVPTSQVPVSRSNSERSESILHTTSSFNATNFNITSSFTVRFPN
jgi:hypothetical protein